jgi:metacaspase-1
MRLLVVSMLLLLAGAGWQGAPTNRYALLIGVGTYPASAGVEPLHAQNDLLLMRETLRRQGFPDRHILTLTDQQATRRAVDVCLDSLAKALPTGARFVLLFSGHCLQTPDTNHDEPDGFDEALLLYDGRPNQPQSLLRDDQIGVYMTRLRARVGPTGHVLFLFDSCHSGSLLRHDEAGKPATAGRGMPALAQVIPASGTSGWFEAGRSTSKLGRYVLLAATADGQPSFECRDGRGQPFGPLTLAVCRAWPVQKTTTYRAFFRQVQQQMTRLAPYQMPIVEGDINAPFLGE